MHSWYFYASLFFTIVNKQEQSVSSEVDSKPRLQVRLHTGGLTAARPSYTVIVMMMMSVQRVDVLTNSKPESSGCY